MLISLKTRISNTQIFTCLDYFYTMNQTWTVLTRPATKTSGLLPVNPGTAPVLTAWMSILPSESRSAKPRIPVPWQFTSR